MPGPQVANPESIFGNCRDELCVHLSECLPPNFPEENTSSVRIVQKDREHLYRRSETAQYPRRTSPWPSRGDGQIAAGEP